MYTSSYVTSYGGGLDIDSLAGAGVWTAIAGVIALVCGILLYFLFVKPDKKVNGKFLKWLKDFLAFRIMWVEPILKIVYYVLTIFSILFSFSFLSLGGSGVLLWLVTMILGPVAIRLGYEFTMMFIMIWRNTRDIAENTEKKK